VAESHIDIYIDAHNYIGAHNGQRLITKVYPGGCAQFFDKTFGGLHYVA